MSGIYRDLAHEVRTTARQEALRAAPPPARYRVVRKKPFTLEAYGSEDRVVDGDDGFDAAAIRTRAKVDDTVLVFTDEHGDRVALALLRSAGEEEEEGGEGVAVDSVFGRTGAVVAKTGDYTVAQITDAAAQPDLEAEEDARIEADAAEKAARESADGAEKTAREAADSSEAGTRAAADVALGEAVADEQSDREADDAAEKAAREAKDAELDGAINVRAKIAELEAEEAARAAADVELGEAIAEEAEAREARDDDSLGVVIHGAEAGKARPTGHDNYIWIGTVVPENMAENDLLAKYE